MAEDFRLVSQIFELEKQFGENLAILRLYQWNPFCISIGFHQTESLFDLEKIKRDGIGFIKRPTGGRAVFHADELTYAFIERASESNSTHYKKIHLTLAEAFSALGIQTDFQKTEPNFSETFSKIESAACFSASARYELEINGRKLVGSAQRRYQFNEGEVLLQHGSILLSQKHQDLAEYLLASDSLKTKIKDDLRMKTISLSELPIPSISTAKLSLAIENSFKKAYG
ncbi:MAG: lipoate--protein ligase family protein [Chloroherpetonaceae bacterium]|nr:lipoate--protein ligase family protein [Chloroherpetonaceae bacterium]